MTVASEEQRKAASDRMKARHAAKRDEKAVNEEVMGALAQEAMTPVRTQEQRVRRNMFNGQNPRLMLEGTIPGWRLYWFNNLPGRIEMALQSGYEFVHKDEISLMASRLPLEANAAMGDRIEMVTTGDPLAGFTRSILMKIRQEDFDADQRDGQDKIAADEVQAVRVGGYNAANVGERYVPDSHKSKGALQIQSTTRRA